MKEESLLLLSDLQKLINQVVLIDYTIIILGGGKLWGKMLLLSFENSEDDVISEILRILENKQMKICENRNIKNA